MGKFICGYTFDCEFLVTPTKANLTALILDTDNLEDDQGPKYGYRKIAKHLKLSQKEEDALKVWQTYISLSFDKQIRVLSELSKIPRIGKNEKTTLG